MARDIENAKRLRKEWYERNKELIKDRARQWALDNPEKRYKIYRKWNSKNQDKKTALEGKRRAAKLNRTPNWLTANDLEYIQALYSVAAMIQRESGIVYHIDHILPLQGKLVSGLHVPNNLRVIPAIENLKKSNKHSV